MEIFLGPSVADKGLTLQGEVGGRWPIIDELPCAVSKLNALTGTHFAVNISLFRVFPFLLHNIAHIFK